MSRQSLGRRGEDLAADHLEACGWQVLARNWRCAHGEIDIVAEDPEGPTVVFVEVRTRSSARAGHPLESIGVRKRRTLRALAGAWLAAQVQWIPRFRIDVIGIVWPPDEVPELTHVRSLS
ncbi:MULTISPECIES: YraN family protein [Brevibacterium]|jgi:putative endonuclease|uniref:UPF0102 protein GCM10009823_27450 n=1 Tax=Brevibacterium salitolerans TaxID=1403566 RepID=A0ABN2X4D8_9MICO|nr:YraN family protein [Brevibacterium sp.]